MSKNRAAAAKDSRKLEVERRARSNNLSEPLNKPMTKALRYRVRNSPIHGRGVFATRTIRKNSRIIEYRGQRITERAANRQPMRNRNDPHHTFLFRLSDGTIIDAAKGGNSARWINHSCAPNCEAIEYEDGGGVFIHALRTIRAGEELVYDYRITMDGRVSEGDRKKYVCACKAPDCRKTLLEIKSRRGK